MVGGLSGCSCKLGGCRKGSTIHCGGLRLRQGIVDDFLMVIFNPTFSKHLMKRLLNFFAYLGPIFQNTARPSSIYKPMKLLQNSDLSWTSMNRLTSSQISAQSKLPMVTSNISSSFFFSMACCCQIVENSFHA